MKYFLDTEFIEGFHKPRFGKRRHHIDLISLSLVSEDGSELHVVSNEYNYKDASPSVKKYVIAPLYRRIVHGDRRNFCNEENFHKEFGISNRDIASSIAVFTKCELTGGLQDLYRRYTSTDLDIQFYGYFSDYDWVLICSLFGTMMDLPKGYPMYCIDLKQMFDECQKDFGRGKERINDLIDLRKHPHYPPFPTGKDEHSDIAEARWAKRLYEFLLLFPESAYRLR